MQLFSFTAVYVLAQKLAQLLKQLYHKQIPGLYSHLLKMYIMLHLGKNNSIMSCEIRALAQIEWTSIALWTKKKKKRKKNASNENN